MKVLCILGSPRKNGNTATVLGWVERELRDLGHEIDHVDINTHRVNGCLECYYCVRNPSDVPNCVQKDDANALFARVMSAEAILLASPLFFWSFSAQIRPLLDRFYCLVTGYGTPEHKSLIAGRRIALLMTGADAYADNAEFAVEIFRRIAKYVQCEIAGELYVSQCTTPDELGADVREQAARLAGEIAAP